MTIELVEIAVRSSAPHPRLAARVTGQVHAVLGETRDGQEHRHELLIPVWTDTAAGDGADDIDMALMLKAAKIVARLKLNLAPR